VHKPDLTEKVAYLSTPGAYTPRPRHVVAIETHFAWVFLTAQEAYKLKKPLRHASMDYRTLARRRLGCSEEVRLNRRLAPSVYRGIEPLKMDRAGRLQLAGRGRTVDWLVRMRRLPAHRMLDTVLRQRALRVPEQAALLATLGAFFGAAPRQPAHPSRQAVQLRHQISQNRRVLLRLVRQYRPLVESVVASQRAARRGLRSELAARAARLREGHGDLRPEHVCLSRGVQIIDSLEFDRGLRRLDPLEEIAFLSLEMERLGRGRCARDLLRAYRRQYDPSASDALVHFYMCHRAMMRAKVSAWHIGDRQFPDPRPWQRRTRSYLRDAQRHAQLALRALARAEPQSAGGQRSSSGVSDR
jgi:uncharacterized protein